MWYVVLGLLTAEGQEAFKRASQRASQRACLRCLVAEAGGWRAGGGGEAASRLEAMSANGGAHDERLRVNESEERK
jgi:hypothetical protein